MSDDDCPQKEGEEGWWHNDSLYEEQDSKLLDWHASQKGLGHPVEKEAQ